VLLFLPWGLYVAGDSDCLRWGKYLGRDSDCLRSGKNLGRDSNCLSSRKNLGRDNDCFRSGKNLGRDNDCLRCGTDLGRATTALLRYESRAGQKSKDQRLLYVLTADSLLFVNLICRTVVKFVSSYAPLSASLLSNHLMHKAIALLCHGDKHRKRLVGTSHMSDIRHMSVASQLNMSFFF
jgi:hypothetical protein